MSFIIENKRTKGESYNGEKNTRSQIVSKYMISLKSPLRSQLPINNCTNHYQKKNQNLTSDDWTPPTAPSTHLHSFLLKIKSAEIQGTLRELVTFRGIYIFLAVTKHSSPCSIDEDTEVKKYTGPLWISVTNRLLNTLGIIKLRAEVAQILEEQKANSSSCSPMGGCCRRATLVYQFQGVKRITNYFYILKNHS